MNLKISKGESVGLVGESGCGKTMTALSVMRLVPSPGRIINGRIVYKGKNLLELTEDEMRGIRGREISIIFQNPMSYLNPIMKVEDQIAEVITAHQRLDKEKAKEKTIEMLKLVRMPSPEKFSRYYPYQLSGGMQQRVLIAAALSCKPSLLIADEPTTALDVTIQNQILHLFKELKKELGLSVLLITHDFGIVADTTDVVYVMYAGKIVERADVVTLYERPKHPYTAGLLMSALSIDELKENLVAIGGTVPNLLDPPSGCRFHPRCSKAMEICKQREPPDVEVENNNIVSCWLYC